MSTPATPTSSSYCSEYLPKDVLEKLEAGAFRSLNKHLQERSDEVQNIDLMTLSGFCRNCLAKWMVLEARNLSDEMKKKSCDNSIIQVLDALGYDEAAQYVYGMDYNDWKKKHAKKASDEQMKRYNESVPLQAKHDKERLKVRVTEKPNIEKLAATKIMYQPPSSTTTTTSNTLLSNVCCTNVDEDVPMTTTTTTAPSKAAKGTRTLPPYVPPSLPPTDFTNFNLAILTISDRASEGKYETGDLSGPAVQKSVEDTILSLNNNSTSQNKLKYNLVHKDIVPDNSNDIQAKLKEWSDRDNENTIHLVLTTGGTGFSKRDVTPEATLNVLDFNLQGLMSFIISECSRVQPLSALSRAVGGVRNNTIIINLPGNPRGVGEIIPILLPILLHAIKDIQLSS